MQATNSPWTQYCYLSHIQAQHFNKTCKEKSGKMESVSRQTSKKSTTVLQNKALINKA